MDEERWKKVKGTYPEEWPLDALDIEDEEKKKKLKELKNCAITLDAGVSIFLRETLGIPLPKWLRIGLTDVVSWIPFADIITMYVSTHIQSSSKDLDIPKMVTTGMYSGTLMDGIIGLVPVAGDTFSFLYKSNLNNFAAVYEYLVKHPNGASEEEMEGYHSDFLGKNNQKIAKSEYFKRGAKRLHGWASTQTIPGRVISSAHQARDNAKLAYKRRKDAAAEAYKEEQKRIREVSAKTALDKNTKLRELKLIIGRIIAIKKERIKVMQDLRGAITSEDRYHAGALRQRKSELTAKIRALLDEAHKVRSTIKSTRSDEEFGSRWSASGDSHAFVASFFENMQNILNEQRSKDPGEVINIEKSINVITRLQQLSRQTDNAEGLDLSGEPDVVGRLRLYRAQNSAEIVCPIGYSASAQIASSGEIASLEINRDPGNIKGRLVYSTRLR